MLSDKVQYKINCMNYQKLEKISDWCWKRYKNNQFPPIAKYITRLHYLREEYMAGLL